MVPFYISFENYFLLFVDWLNRYIFREKKRHKCSDLFGIKLNYSGFMQTKKYEWLLLTANLPWLYHYLWRQYHIHCLTFTNKQTNKKPRKTISIEGLLTRHLIMIFLSSSFYTHGIGDKQTNNRMKSIMVKKMAQEFRKKFEMSFHIRSTTGISHSLKNKNRRTKCEKK